MGTIIYILLALLLLGIMVTVHELGHFCAARACGIAVRAFGVGFGPKLLSWTGKKSGTEYSLRLIPCGGFCAFYGEDDAQGKDKEDPRSMLLQPAWKRLITIAAGPVMNFVLAFVVALAFFMGYGLPYADGPIMTTVQSVSADSPAEQAGFQANDVILSVNDHAINGNLSAYVDAWQTGDAPLRVTVQRGEEQVELQVTPFDSEAEGRKLIGVNILLTQQGETVWRRAPFGTTLSHTWNVCVSAGGAILDALGRSAEAKIYRDEAKRRANSWLERATVGDHTALTFDGQGWSLKYNLVWDKLFGLELLPDSFYSQETKSYLARSNTYGIPLDSRSALTKSDWLLWCAAMADEDDFAAFLHPVARYVRETPSRVPFSDFYHSEDGVSARFIARTVQGGLYMPLLMDRWKKRRGSAQK